MSSSSMGGEPLEIREIPWAGIILCCIGGLALLTGVIPWIIIQFAPPKNPPPWPAFPYVVGGAGAVILALGIYLCKSAKVVMRLTKETLELPSLEAAIPWPEVDDVDVVYVQPNPQGPTAPVLAMMLTTKGRELISGRKLSTSPHAESIHPRPDVCLKVSFVSFGPGIESPNELAADLRKRSKAATGEVDDTPDLPEMHAPLTPRDTSATGDNARVYIHDECGGATVISDGSFYWAANPLRYSGGASVCANCGVAYDHLLRWQDTGESLARFRSRMWKRTPIWVKLLQFLIVPALIAVAAAYFVPQVFPAHPDVSPQVASLIFLGVGFIAGVMGIWLTPLAGLIPALAGYRYHKYR